MCILNCILISKLITFIVISSYPWGTYCGFCRFTHIHTSRSANNRNLFYIRDCDFCRVYFFFFLEFHHFRHYLTINIWISSKNQKAIPNTWFQYINSFWCSRPSLIPCLQPWRCIRICKSVSETDVGHCHGLSHYRVPRRIVRGKYERGHIWRSSDISSKGTLQVDIPTSRGLPPKLTNPGIHEPWGMEWHSKCVISHALPCDIETISLIISIRTKNNARDSWKTFFVLRLDYLRSFVNIVLIFFQKKEEKFMHKTERKIPASKQKM